jgi:hypothetical protein
MNCPKCGKENPDNAHVCTFCKAPLSQVSYFNPPVTVKISRLSIIALVLALLSVSVIYPLPYLLLRLLGSAALLFPLLAVILGIISIIRIEKSGGEITGRAFAIGAVLIPVFSIFLAGLCTVRYGPRSTAFRMVCGTNLSGLGKAMLIYSNDYDDEFPRAGGRSSVWSSKIPDWHADHRFDAYGVDRMDGTGGQVTISSSLYLLVKYAEVTPKSFLCNKDKGVKEFSPADYGVRNLELIALWDFGLEPTKHCSYSYHMPYGPYALTTSCEPGLAVAADRSPWVSSPFVKAKDISRFNPDGDREAISNGNSVSHQSDGQNVLFMDAHVDFERHSFCGIDGDNIYTFQDGQDIRRGAVPNIKSQPANRLDSMLVNDIIPGKTKK